MDAANVAARGPDAELATVSRANQDSGQPEGLQEVRRQLLPEDAAAPPHTDDTEQQVKRMRYSAEPDLKVVVGSAEQKHLLPHAARTVAAASNRFEPRESRRYLATMGG